MRFEGTNTARGTYTHCTTTHTQIMTQPTHDNITTHDMTKPSHHTSHRDSGRPVVPSSLISPSSWTADATSCPSTGTALPHPLTIISWSSAPPLHPTQDHHPHHSTRHTEDHPAPQTRMIPLPPPRPDMHTLLGSGLPHIVAYTCTLTITPSS